MSRIDRLRRQLVALAGRQRFTKRGASVARILVAVLLVLAAIFVVDFLFDLPPVQRMIAIGVGLAALLRVSWRNAAAFGASPSSVAQTALQTANESSGDLVAALQFSSQADVSQGSLQLKQAVIHHVESAPINIFANFRWTELRNAFAALVCLCGIAWAAVAFFPVHANVFLNRLALGNRLYPQATEILAVTVNGQFVLQRRAGDEAQPQPAACGQGKPVVIQVRMAGHWPETGALHLTAQKTGAARSIELNRLSTKQRKAPLRRVQATLRRALENPGSTSPSIDEIAALVAIEAPEIDEGGSSGATRSDQTTFLQETLEKVEARLKRLDKGPEDAVWECELTRLIEPAWYRVSLGAGRTAAGRLNVVEVPVIDLDVQVTPPEYASMRVAAPASLARQFAVLEGSRVDLTLRALTETPLRRAWLTVWQGEEETRIDLTQSKEPRSAAKGGVWKIPANKAAIFANVIEETRYEAMAEDIDGYSIEKPLSGMIRVKPDRPPTGSAQVVHRVVLPSAAPVINYRVNDDFAVAQARIAAQVERQSDDRPPTAEPGVSAETSDIEAAQPEKKRFVAFDEIKTKDELPAKGLYTLELAKLGLKKGDRLKLTIEVLDYRGQADGKWSASEAIFLEISDETGVLSAISETDERSEQKLDDLIRRELGIGDEP